MPDTLLNYQILTQPDPFTASSATGNASQVTLTIMVSKPAGPDVDCSQIKFIFNQGDDEGDLFSHTGGINATAASGSGWGISQDGASFTATPNTPDDGRFGRGVDFTISSISVNATAGTTFMRVEEDAAQVSGASRDTRKTKVNLVKASITDDTLLDYEVVTDPNPLQASPQTGSALPASLKIIVTNMSRRDTVNCSSITFSFLSGPNANEFFADSTGINSTAPSGWNITSEGDLFTATPATTSDGEVAGNELDFVLSNVHVNTQAGATFMTVAENASRGGTTPMPTMTRRARVKLVKAPPGFTFDDPSVTPKPPIAFGDSVTIGWNGSSGATYEIRYRDASGDSMTIDSPKGEQGPLPNSGNYTFENLQGDTTFYVDATLPGPLVVEKFITVVVDQPHPEITLFTGKLELVSSVWNLVPSWTTKNADHCTLTGLDYPLNPSATDHSTRIELRRDNSSSATCTLRANNGLLFDESHINVDWQLRAVSSSWILNTGVYISSIDVSPDGTRIYVAYGRDSNFSLAVLDAATLQPIGNSISLGRTSDMYRIAVAPDGAHIYVAGCSDRKLWVVDTQAFQSGSATFANFSPFALAVSVDGKTLYVLDSDCGLRTLDSGSLQFTNRIAFGARNFLGSGGGVAVSPDGTKVYVATAKNLNAFTADTLTLLRTTQDFSPQLGGVSVSPDGQRIYVVNRWESTLMGFTAQTLEPVGQPLTPGVSGDPTTVSSSKKGPIYVGDDSGVLAVCSDASITGGKQPA